MRPLRGFLEGGNCEGKRSHPLSILVLAPPTQQHQQEGKVFACSLGNLVEHNFMAKQEIVK